MTKHDFFTKLLTLQSWHNLTPKTQEIYLSWFHRYIDFLITYPEKKHPSDKIMDFLHDYLQYSASSKKQAASAIKWLYTHVFNQCVSPLKIKKAWVLPEVLSQEVVALELSKMPQKYQLMGWLFFGSGLTLSECLSLRHGHIRKGYILMPDRDDYIPLCKQARHLYKAYPEKTSEQFVFSGAKKTRPLSQTAFLMQCRKYHIDRRITPGVLRANFVLLSLEKHGVSWTQAVTGLSNARMQQYLAMQPARAKSPLDTFN